MSKVVLAAIVTAGLGLVAGCGERDPARQSQIDSDLAFQVGRKSLESKLKDPKSAQYRDVYAAPSGRVFCGEVNAKNSFGGYAGFANFIIVRDEAGFFALLDGTDEKYGEGVPLCAGKAGFIKLM